MDDHNLNPGDKVLVDGRGHDGRDTWTAEVLMVRASGWVEIKRTPGGGIHIVPRRWVRKA